MFENPFKRKRTEEANALHLEHLKEGVAPIMAAILDDSPSLGDSEQLIEQIKGNSDAVNYYGDPKTLREQGMLTAGEKTYVISDCNTSDKRSSWYSNCTGIAVIGRDAETGEELSILSHQDPETFLNWASSGASAFRNDLSSQLQKLMALAEPGTVDAVIFGGNYESPKEHVDSIVTVAEICKRELGFEPVALTGPDLNATYPTAAFLDTQHRRLFLVRSRQSHTVQNVSYLPKDIKKQSRLWDENREPRKLRDSL